MAETEPTSTPQPPGENDSDKSCSNSIQSSHTPIGNQQTSKDVDSIIHNSQSLPSRHSAECSVPSPTTKWGTGVLTQSPITPPLSSGHDSGLALTSPDDSSSEASTDSRLAVAEDISPKLLLVEEDSPTKSSNTTEVVSSSSIPGPSSEETVRKAESQVPTNQGTGAEMSETGCVYYIKWIQFHQTKVPVITQNENGPCPLLAIMNILLLNGKVKLAPMMEMVTSEQLMTYLGDCILDSRPENLTEATQPNYEQNVQDAIGIMYKLQTGLDVNVRFTGVGDFEYTPECIIFDLLGISLYHGWLVDPQDKATVTAVDQCSYNQLVETIIACKASQDEDQERKGLIAEQFLYGTASQLTYHGLCELSTVIKEGQLCVFFRNNHFNTLYKHQNELFVLVTDQGYMVESGVVWETLSNVEGDGHFVDAQFRTYTKPAPSSTPIPDPDVTVGSAEQIDHDYQVALSLQEEDTHPTTQANWPASPDTNNQLTDHELALRLQEEEHMSALSEQQQQQLQQQHHPSRQGSSGLPGTAYHPSRPSGPESVRRRDESRDRESKCSIL